MSSTGEGRPGRGPGARSCARLRCGRRAGHARRWFAGVVGLTGCAAGSVAEEAPAAVPQATYKGVQGVRCVEHAGQYPVGGKSTPWSDEIGHAAWLLCEADESCQGIMRYVGDNAVHCDDWCGRPQFCAATGPVVQNDHWVTFFKSVPPQPALRPGISEVRCPVRRRGGTPEQVRVLLWSQVDVPAEPPEDAEDACHVHFIPAGGTDATPSWLEGVISDTEGSDVPFFSAQMPHWSEPLPWRFSLDLHRYPAVSLKLSDDTWYDSTRNPIIHSQPLREEAEKGQEKRHLLSVLLLSPDAGCPGPGGSLVGAMELAAMLPGHVYVDNGAPHAREKAFVPYRFVIICGDFGALPFPGQPLIDSLAFAAHPLIPQEWHLKLSRVFFHLPDAAQAFKAIHIPNLEVYLTDMLTNPEKENMVEFKQTFLLLTNTLFLYRYRSTPMQRLQEQACTLCTERRRSRRLAETGQSDAVLVLFSTMTRRKAASLRQAVRDTWGRSVREIAHARLRFFVGEGDDPLTDAGTDVVTVQVLDSYRFLNVKAFLMLEWTFNKFPDLRWLVRHDDDIYLRPYAIMSLLSRRVPVKYLWGNFDHGSRPVRDPAHPHYNSYEQFAEQSHPMWGDLFPPYARGHLWAMSADLLALVVGTWRNEKALGEKKTNAEMSKLLPHPDDPAIGVVISNLVREDNIGVNLDDRDFNSFSLNPSCNSTFSNIHSRTWVVHHVHEEIMHCMWKIDAADSATSHAASGVDGWPRLPPSHTFPDLCPCSTEVEEEEDPTTDAGHPFWYPRTRFQA